MIINLNVNVDTNNLQGIKKLIENSLQQVPIPTDIFIPKCIVMSYKIHERYDVSCMGTDLISRNIKNIDVSNMSKKQIENTLENEIKKLREINETN